MKSLRQVWAAAQCSLIIKEKAVSEQAAKQPTIETEAILKAWMDDFRFRLVERCVAGIAIVAFGSAAILDFQRFAGER